MLERLTVADPRAAALFAHARRRKILLSMIEGERTQSELAQMTQTPLSLLHHHLGKLVRAGLAEVSREVPRAGAPLKYHRAIAREFFLPAEVMASTPGEELNARLRALLDRGLRRTLLGAVYSHDGAAPRMRLVRDEPRELGMELWLEARLRREDAQALEAELTQVVRRFASKESSDGSRYVVHVAVAAV